MWATHALFKLPWFNCVSLVASPPLLKYLPIPLVGNPIIKILDTPLRMVMANAINLPAFNHCNHDMAAVAFTRVGL